MQHRRAPGGLRARLAALDALRERWTAGLADRTGGPIVRPASPLRPVSGFGSNPGALRMHLFAPDRLPPRPALVVLLHGCTQDAVGFDHGTGWSTLAERYGFVLLCPEQTETNNPKTCFNWFLPGDTARDSGEALSIRQMIGWTVAAHGIDPSRIFVTGLSAGGAMTAALLAAYPDVFAAGAIVAGLPAGAARNVGEALDGMFKGRTRPAEEWGDLVRSASGHRGPWPRVSVWHGDQDRTVLPSNGAETVKQWLDVHGLSDATPRWKELDGHGRVVWCDAAGREAVESVTVAGLAHGAPLAAAVCGKAGPFLLEAGISSAHHIARFFGLTGEAAGAGRPGRAEPGSGLPGAAPPSGEGPPPGPAEPARARARPPSGPLEISSAIGSALEAAGLVRPR